MGPSGWNRLLFAQRFSATAAISDAFLGGAGREEEEEEEETTLIHECILYTYIRASLLSAAVLSRAIARISPARNNKVAEPDMWSSGFVAPIRANTLPAGSSECRLFRIEWLWPRPYRPTARYEPQWELSDRRADFR